MRFLLPQALFAGRQALQQPIVRSSIAQRACTLSLTQTASASFKTQVGYRSNPSDVPVNSTPKNKIPQKLRPIKRPFVPPPTKTEEQLASLYPYLIRRTPYLQLPVYRKFLSGGTRILILMKKVDGDRARLVQDLTTALELKPRDIRLNPTTQHIEIKGNHYEKAKDWLLEAGF